MNQIFLVASNTCKIHSFPHSNDFTFSKTLINEILTMSSPFLLNKSHREKVRILTHARDTKIVVWESYGKVGPFWGPNGGDHGKDA